MEQMYGCPNCRAQIAYGQSICGYCGVTLDWGAQPAPPPSSNQQQTWGQQMYGCPQCQAQVAYGQSACGYCGVTLDWGVQQAPPPPYNQQYLNQQQTGGQQLPPSNRPPSHKRPPGWRNPSQHKQQNNIYGKAIALLTKKHSSGIHLSLIALVLVLVAAGGIALALSGNSSTPSSKPPTEPIQASTTPTAPPPAKPPAITSFSVNPGTITKGQKANLSWNVTGATAVSIDQGIGTVSASGTKEVFPAETPPAMSSPPPAIPAI